MTAETDEQFLDGAEYAYGHHMVPQHRARLFALARRGAAAAARIERLETGLWDVHAYCNNWAWFLWMWPIRKIKRIVKAALDYRQMEGK